MLLFWIAVAALTCAATASLVLPLLRAGHASSRAADDEARRVAVYRDRRAEIESERAAGRLSDDEARRAVDELITDAAVQLPAASGDAVRAPAAGSRGRAIAIAVVAALTVPLGALLVYATLGSPSIVSLDAATLRGEITPQRLQQAIDELRERVAKAPEDVEAWALLAQAQRMQGAFAESASAYGRAAALLPGNARLLAEQAESAMLAQRGDFAGEPVRLLERALAADPNDGKAVALMGAAQYRLGNRAEALRYMRKLAAAMEPGTQEAQRLAEVIATIEAEIPGRPPASSGAPGAGATPPATAAAPPGTGATAATISGAITIDDALRAAIPQGAALFVVARSAEGSRVPVAALRVEPGEWPVRFELGDAQAMDPSRPLSRAGPVVVEARVSLAGTAARRSGDPFGESAPVAPGTRDLAIRIDRRVP